MGIFRYIGLFAIIPSTVFLTVSFFVLFANSKIDSKKLKFFGYVVAALLWISSILILSTGVYISFNKNCPMINMMRQKGCFEMRKMDNMPMMDKNNSMMNSGM